MTHRSSGTRIGRRSVLVGLLVLAAVAGLSIGSFFGGSAKIEGSPSSSNSAIPSAVPSMGTMPSPSLSPTAPGSAGPDTSAKPVLELEGNGNKRSAEFEVIVGWQIQWQTEAAHIKIVATGEPPLGTILDL